MSELKLSDDHVYTVGDRPLIGVTETIQTNFGKRSWYSDWHAGKGKALHLAIHYLVTDQLDWDSVDPQILGRVKAFLKAYCEVGFEVLGSEIMMYSRRYHTAGTMDQLWQKDGLVVADIKSHIEPIVEIQLGGYCLMYEENFKRKVKKACAIQLKDNGNYNFEWYAKKEKDVINLKRLFLANLTLANWRKLNYPNKGETQ